MLSSLIEDSTRKTHWHIYGSPWSNKISVVICRLTGSKDLQTLWTCQNIYIIEIFQKSFNKFKEQWAHIKAIEVSDLFPLIHKDITKILREIHSINISIQASQINISLNAYVSYFWLFEVLYQQVRSCYPVQQVSYNLGKT